MSYTLDAVRSVMEEQGEMSQYLHPHHNTPVKLEGVVSQPNGLWDIEMNQFPVHHNSCVPISKFRGVVSLANGNWGAQISVNHQWVGLGVFRTEKEAAMAYDSAAIRLRSADPHRNFLPTTLTFQEHMFQRQLSSVSLLAMIRDHTYTYTFAGFVEAQSYNCGAHLQKSNVGSTVKELFQKELTGLDVASKLNRLIIPIRCATKRFGAVVKDVDMKFFDREKNPWKFRYGKCKRNYVFTKGWNRFVHAKRLKIHDRVIFSTDESSEALVHIIDVSYSSPR